MLEKLIKYRILFIIALLLLCIFFIESPYHGDYYGEPPYIVYFLITMICLLVYLIPTNQLTFVDKFIFSGITSILVLVGGGLFIEKIMSLIFGYDSNWDELKSPVLLDSFLFYFITTFCGIGIFDIWFRYKKPVN